MVDSSAALKFIAISGGITAAIFGAITLYTRIINKRTQAGLNAVMATLPTFGPVVRIPVKTE
ncbi:MAG: hypothetical protein HY692_05895 [Cyanobacteria bacterium NC_groundwater_1444_Ag_S-0.65um_54_12]|nr:hypothetical protein [Cyanobacteria bacterium NC_groundwater_1444_Ag_S-0.65um_54_12]